MVETLADQLSCTHGTAVTEERIVSIIGIKCKCSTPHYAQSGLPVDGAGDHHCHSVSHFHGIPTCHVMVSTREMQGVVGQASNFKLGGHWPAHVSAFCETLCQSPTGLSCRSFDRDRCRKMEKFKGDRQATLWYGFFFV